MCKYMNTQLSPQEIKYTEHLPLRAPSQWVTKWEVVKPLHSILMLYHDYMGLFDVNHGWLTIFRVIKLTSLTIVLPTHEKSIYLGFLRSYQSYWYNNCKHSTDPIIKHRVISHRMIGLPICRTLRLEIANVAEDSSPQTGVRSQEITVKSLFWFNICPPEVRFDPKMSFMTSQKSTKKLYVWWIPWSGWHQIDSLWPSDAIWRSV